MATLLDSLTSLAAPAVSRIAQRLGESDAAVARGLQASVASVLGGVLTKSTNVSGIHRILDLITSRDNAGGLGEAATFTARVTITSAQQPESALNFTDSFSSALPKGGTAVRTFEASRGGNSAVTLTTARAPR